MTDSLEATCAVPAAAVDLIAEPALVPPAIAAAAVAGGALLIDVRSEQTRLKQGRLPQAVVADRTRLDEQFGLDSDGKLPGVTGHDQPVVVICGSENGSRPVAEALTAQGFGSVIHVAGGFPAWAAAGLPAESGTEAR